MKIKIYNTLTKIKEFLKPTKDKIVNMYICGPTVYDFDHLGHARVGVFYDVVRRYLIESGYKVKFVQNITDVGHLTETETGDDKIEKKAKSENKTPEEIVKFFTQEHFKDFKSLNILKPDFSPKASEYIPQIIEFIKVLIKKGYAYKVKSGVYFDISKFENYGKLSKRNFEKEKQGTRIESEKDKKNPLDFALWKIAKFNHIQNWKSPWGIGYPGWHIECSVMNNEIFKTTTDIHGGAIELSFPHHENEIAQSESYNNIPFVKYWMHIGLVKVNDEKMSKSKNNFITIKDLLKKYDFNLIRLTLLSTCYRKPFDYSEEKFTQDKIILDKLIEAKEKVPNENKNDNKVLKQIEKAFSDDFNTPLVLQIWFKNRLNISKKLFNKIENIFGLNLNINSEIPDEIKKLVDRRKKARQEKKWAESDRIRDLINVRGFEIEDTENGIFIRKK
jgi:cysteinyl-tRNA synthetase